MLDIWLDIWFEMIAVLPLATANSPKLTARCAVKPNTDGEVVRMHAHAVMSYGAQLF
jgi:hypothetical protein